MPTLQRGGATIAYDAIAPVFHTNEERRSDVFLQQREEIRRVVFESENLQKPSEHVRFWDQYRRGKGTGVMEP